VSYEFYNVVHVIGVILLFSSLGVLTATAGSESTGLRRTASIAHGIALAIVFVAGFGLLARLGHFGAIPIWAYFKMALWAALGGMIVILKRRPESAIAVWWLLPVVGGAAAWLAVSQPFS
jgi:hypothetical protein